MMSLLVEAKSDGHIAEELLCVVRNVMVKNPMSAMSKIRTQRKKKAGRCSLHIISLKPAEIVDTVQDAVRCIGHDFSNAAEWAVVIINDKTRILEVVEMQRTNTWHHRRHADATVRTRLRATYWLLILTQRVGIAAELAEALLKEVEGSFSKLHYGWEQTTTRAAVIDPDICDTRLCNYECLRHCPPRRAGFGGDVTDTRLVIAAENCIDCGNCVNKCPLGAITMMEIPKW